MAGRRLEATQHSKAREVSRARPRGALHVTHRGLASQGTQAVMRGLGCRLEGQCSWQLGGGTAWSWGWRRGACLEAVGTAWAGCLRKVKKPWGSRAEGAEQRGGWTLYGSHRGAIKCEGGYKGVKGTSVHVSLEDDQSPRVRPGFSVLAAKR